MNYFDSSDAQHQISAVSADVVVLFQPSPVKPIIAFDRYELQCIFNVYSRYVARGEWKDYALDFLKDRAVFSIYRRASEVPIFRIEKIPELARKQGQYRIVTAAGVITKRGHELQQVLRVFAEKPRVLG